MGIYFKGMTIYHEEGIATAGEMYLEGGKIAHIGHDQLIKGEGITYTFPASYSAIPGFIDIHIHGANGYDVMDGTEEALHEMARFLPMEGTTSFLATTMTASPQGIEAVIATLKKYKKIILAGPAISKKMCS